MFSSGVTAGSLTMGTVACAGATGSRPNRPATIGLVDGLMCHANVLALVTICVSRVSVKNCTGPVSEQNASRQTGEVAVSNVLYRLSREPAGADPVSTECRDLLAVAESMSKNASRLPP